MKKNRFVITGIGAITSLGLNPAELYSSLIIPKNGFAYFEDLPFSEEECRWAATVENFDPFEFMPAQLALNIGSAAQYAIAAGTQALVQAKLTKKNNYNIGVVIGTSSGEGREATKINKYWLAGEKNKAAEIIKRKYAMSSIPANISRYFKANGPSIILPTACEAGNHALGLACRLLEFGQADIVIAGGTEAFPLQAVIGFHKMRSLAKKIVRPFDKDREGIIIGEGAGILIVEKSETALARGAQILAEIAGVGYSSDGYHPTAPHPEGAGAQKAMRAALQQAGLPAGKIDYINAHGTGTPANDAIETKAIKKVFGKFAKKIPVSSIKSMLGHCLGAASAIEAVACCKILEKQIIPPTNNYQNYDPACDLDYVPNKARPAKVNTILSNAFAFGGNNCVVVFKKYEK